MKVRHGKLPIPNISHTFAEPLNEYVQMTNGNVCQYGPSFESCEIILKHLQNTDRKLYSLCSDLQEYNMIKEAYPKSDNHIIIFFNEYGKLFGSVEDKKFSVIFIDGQPMNTRNYAMSTLCKNCDYMLVHDARLLMDNGYLRPQIYFEDVELYYPYEVDMTYRRTATAICSKCKK